MPIALDGFEVLRRLGKHADLFVVVRSDVDKQARALVVKCLKAKTVGPEAIHEIQKALGGEQFGLVIEGLKDAEVKTILTRLDKYHPDLKTGAGNWRRQHLNALADGSSTPTAPPAKSAKKASKKTRLSSETMDVFREGANKKS